MNVQMFGKNASEPSHQPNNKSYIEDNERKTKKRLKYRQKHCSGEVEENNFSSKTSDTPVATGDGLRCRHVEHYSNGTSNGKAMSKYLYYPESVDKRLQIIIVGDRNVGKTSFLERFTDDTFNEEANPTVGIDFKMKIIAIGGLRIRLQIWDTAGQERFNSITTAYYRSASGVLLVYDVTKPESYTNLTKWLELVEQYAPSDAEIAIVGNKADLQETKVSSSNARNFAEKNGYLFYEASAKENLNIDSAITTLVYKILKQIPPPHERNPRVLRKTNITINSNNVVANKKKPCC